MEQKTFDMRQCKPGDKLISRHGLVLTYEGPNNFSSANMYPHLVRYPDGAYGTRADNGLVSLRKPLETDHDIVGFAE